MIGLLECASTLFIFILGKGVAIYQKNVPPVIELSADNGSNITLPCNIGIKMDQMTQWVRPGKQRNHMTVIMPNGDLFLSAVEKNDTGLYECYSENFSESNDNDLLAQIRLRVKTVPGMVNVTIIPSSVLALIQWIVDDGGYPITNIAIWYNELTAGHDIYWHILHPKYISISARQADIYNLIPNSSYVFRIYASNKLGDGPVRLMGATTLYDKQEIELAKHLLVGADTFDTRAWIAAVAIVMITLILLTIGTCLVLYRDSRISLTHEPEKDPEKIELIPNVILNPSNRFNECQSWNKTIPLEEEHEFNNINHTKNPKPVSV